MTSTLFGEQLLLEPFRRVVEGSTEEAAPLRECAFPPARAGERTLTESRQAARVRSLKIEAHGDFWKGQTKPKIRLMGCWLQRAGFTPGNRVQVKCVAPGVMELRSTTSLALAETVTVPGCGFEPVKESASAVEPPTSTPKSIARSVLAQRTPDQFAFCGPHFYNASPRTRALGTYWKTCVHCGRPLGYFGTREEAQANRAECTPQPVELSRT